MRIGLVLSSFPGYSETFFHNKIKGLRDRGYEIFIFIDNRSAQHYPGVKVVYALPMQQHKIRLAFIVGWALLKSLLVHTRRTLTLFKLDAADGKPFISRLKTVVLNSHIIPYHLDWLHFGFGTLALERENLAKAVGAKMAVSFRGFDIGIYAITHPGCYKNVYRKADKIHVISNDLSDLLIKDGLSRKGILTKITPAIDTSVFKPSPWPHNPIPQLLSIARLHWKKGLDYTLFALADLKQRGYYFHYTVLGEGKEREKLTYLVHALGLTEEVRLPGKVAHESVKRYLEEADIYIQYSVQEGFCNAVLEAQAMGKICVVSDAEGLPENVLHKTTGYVVPKRNPSLLAQQLIDTLSMESHERKTIAEQAIQRVRKEFSLESQIEKFDRFYS